MCSMINLVLGIDFILMSNWLIINYNMVIVWEIEYIYFYWLLEINFIWGISGFENGKKIVDVEVD